MVVVNLDAGRGRSWHYGVARQYALVARLPCVGHLVGGGPWILAFIPAWFGARAINAAWEKKSDLPFPVFRPTSLLERPGSYLHAIRRPGPA
jgi:hypothetical protein